jgi:hypothetical protein
LAYSSPLADILETLFGAVKGFSGIWGIPSDWLSCGPQDGSSDGRPFPSFLTIQDLEKLPSHF